MADFKQSRAVFEDHKQKEGEAEVSYDGTRKPFGELTVKVDIDASDAIRALKALQREARKATQALRELESEAEELSGSEIAELFAKGEVVTREQLRKLIEWLTETYRELGGEQVELQRDGVILTKEQSELLTRTAEMHKGEVVIPKEQAEKIASTKPPTNITINIPEIKVKDDADIEKIAKELAEKLRVSKFD
jgi:phage-related minor tail protein